MTQLDLEPDAVIELTVTEADIEAEPKLSRRRDQILEHRPGHDERFEPMRAYYRQRGTYHATSGAGGYKAVGATLVAIVTGDT